MDKQTIFTEVKMALVELFEVDGDAVTLDAHLYQDLELDSIDAVDLVVRLQKLTGKKIRPEEFKAVRTVNDLVDAVATLLADA
jgi:acyl carrier protein